MKAELKEGIIPKFTKCPYHDECCLHLHGCKHKGHHHDVDYSCALARAFELVGLKEIVRLKNVDIAN